MIFITSDKVDAVADTADFLRQSGLDVKVLSLEDFPNELKGGVELVIYDIEKIREMDILNITLAKKKKVPLILIIPYLSDKGLDEVSRLWKGGYLKDCLIKPITMDDLMKYIPLKKRGY